MVVIIFVEFSRETNCVKAAEYDYQWKLKCTITLHYLSSPSLSCRALDYPLINTHTQQKAEKICQHILLIVWYWQNWLITDAQWMKVTYTAHSYLVCVNTTWPMKTQPKITHKIDHIYNNLFSHAKMANAKLLLIFGKCAGQWIPKKNDGRKNQNIVLWCWENAFF